MAPRIKEHLLARRFLFSKQEGIEVQGSIRSASEVTEVQDIPLTRSKVLRILLIRLELRWRQGYDSLEIVLSYPAMYLSQSTLKVLHERLKALNDLRPISPSIMSKIRERFSIEMTYNSNAIEGNSLTLKETFWVKIGRASCRERV